MVGPPTEPGGNVAGGANWVWVGVFVIVGVNEGVDVIGTGVPVGSAG